VKLGSKFNSNVGKHGFHKDNPHEIEFYIVAYGDHGQNKVESWVTKNTSKIKNLRSFKLFP
jgi:hypothetical protein